MHIAVSANEAIVSEAKMASPEFEVALDGTDNDLNEILIALYQGAKG